MKCFYTVVLKYKILNKMPCQYCRNPSHRIASCDSSVERWIGPINEMWVSQRYNILEQIETLKVYSQVKLLMVGRSQGKAWSSGSKQGLITRLVENHILTQVVPQAEIVSLEAQASINNSYEMLLESDVLGSRTLSRILTDALEQYYVARLGQRRTGRTMEEVMYSIENPGEVLQDVVVSVNQSMEEVGECGLCYESKSRVKFNCLHEFCKDCVHLMCAHKGEHAIKCPMCRASVTTFEVEDEASREALLVVA